MIRKRTVVHVQLSVQSSPCTHTDVKSTYQKGDLFCVMLVSGNVYKYPVASIFRVIEETP